MVILARNPKDTTDRRTRAHHRAPARWLDDHPWRLHADTMDGRRTLLPLKTTVLRAPLAVLLATVGGCQSGSLDVLLSASATAKNGLAAEDTEDGVVIRLEKLLVTLADVELTSTARPGARFGGDAVYSVLAAAAPVGTLVGLDAGPYDRFQFAVSPATESTVAEPRLADDLALMQALGASIYVEGTIALEGTQKRFAWGFDANTRYVNCADATGTPGLTLSGNDDLTTIVVAAEQLFGSDLTAPGTAFRGAVLMAADDNGDDTIDRDELEGIELRTLDDGLYEVGAATDVVTLGDFVRAQSRSLPRLTETGSCAAEKR